MLINLLFLLITPKDTLDLQVKDLSEKYFYQCYLRLKYLLQDDVVLIINSNDLLYRIFRKEHPISDNQVLFVNVTNFKINTKVISSLNEVKKYNRGKYFYFHSERNIKINNLIKSLGKTPIKLENVGILLRHKSLSKFVNNLIQLFMKEGVKEFKNEEIIFTDKNNRITLEIKGLQPFIFTNPAVKNDLTKSLEIITQKNLKKISTGSSKLLFLENYVDDVLVYLKSNDYIFSKDVEKYHTLIPSLFGFKMVDPSTHVFSSQECITTGVTLSKVVSDNQLEGVINKQKFGELTKLINEVIFTNIIE